MRLSQEDISFFKKLSFSNGKNSIFYLDSSEELLLKKFRNDKYYDHKFENIEYLLLFPIIKNSAYPIESLIIEDESVGYTCKFYENAKCFCDENSFSFKQKHQAIRDCCMQLNTLHHYGAIFNDMNCHNQLISETGGHLIDFENVFIPEKFSHIPSKSYHLYSSKEIVKISKKSDQVRQYIISLGLLYEINLEILFSKANSDVELLYYLFDMNEDINCFLHRCLPCLHDSDVEVFDYFDSLLPKLSDEEKLEYEKGKLREKRIIQRIPYFL